MAALTWEEREHVTGAVRAGQAVDDPDLALLAAEHVRVTRARLLHVLLAVVPVGVAAGIGVAVIADDSSGDATGSVVGAVVAALAVGAAIVWAASIRPFTLAVRANLHRAGIADSDVSLREPSHWVLAWLAMWPVLAVVGGLLHALGLPLAAPAGFGLTAATIWFAKRALDDRSAERSGSTTGRTRGSMRR